MRTLDESEYSKTHQLSDSASDCQAIMQSMLYQAAVCPVHQRFSQADSCQTIYLEHNDVLCSCLPVCLTLSASQTCSQLSVYEMLAGVDIPNVAQRKGGHVLNTENV